MAEKLPASLGHSREFCPLGQVGRAPDLGPLSIVEYMGLKVRDVDATEAGGGTISSCGVTRRAEAPCAIACIRLAFKPAESGPPVPAFTPA